MGMHQYVERETGSIRAEALYGDRVIDFLYSGVRENAPLLFRILTGGTISRFLGFLSYDSFMGSAILGQKRFLTRCGIDLSECLEPPEHLDTPRKIFERKIRYRERRPMPEMPHAVVSPADSRVLVGSFADQNGTCLKGKFFTYPELLGIDKREWLNAFDEGDFAVFRLSPDKYHYNHTPVAGRVLDFYTLSGAYHSCNPCALITMATPYCLNKRAVTIIDTDVTGGTGVGLVAMIEVAALMIGEIEQCYSADGYEAPWAMVPGMFLRKGQPKSLFRPGSSTDLILFQKGRIRFAADLVRNQRDTGTESRFSHWLGTPLVETDVKVRSLVAGRS